MPDEKDKDPAVPRPASGSHLRSRAHFHKQHSDWVFVEQPEIPEKEASHGDDGIDLWVIYKQPEDYPDKHVVRHWFVTENDRWVDDPPFAVTDTLEEARLAIQPPHRLRLGRYEDPGDPSVLEAWM